MAQIKHLSDLRSSYRAPNERVINKVQSTIDQHAKRFIELSSFFTISTTDKNGFIDTSPRGGEPGFVKILSETDILFPDSRGNNRLDTFENVLRNPKAGLIFLVPGVDETLRAKGEVTLHDDPEYLSLFDDYKFKPSVAAKITVTELFFHCGKAAMRSELWGDQYKIERSDFPSLGRIMKDQQNLQDSALTQEEVVVHYRETL